MSPGSRSLVLPLALGIAGCAGPASGGGDPAEAAPSRAEPRAEESPEGRPGPAKDGRGATAPPGAAPRAAEERGLKDEPAIEVPPLEPGEGPREVIDLATALRLAGARNIDVKLLEERLEAARADVDAAAALFLPELAVGVGYVRHDGRFQETRGDVFDVSRSSLSAGPGVRLSLDPAGAHFERLRAKQALDAVHHGAARTRAETVVRSALLYLELVKTRGSLEVARDAVTRSREQVRVSESMVDLRAELRVNLVRARAELARDEQRLLEATSDLQRASVDLAVWLRLPPTTLIVPVEERIVPVTLVDPDEPVEKLLETALSARPDLQELEAFQRAAEDRLEGARWSPWAPSVDLLAGYGAFGGGRGSFFGDFGDRGDYGAALTWSFDGLGFGDRARYRRARAEAREASLRHAGLEEAIAGAVIRTRDEARSLRSRLEAARSRVEAAREAMDLVTARHQAGDAIQLEVLEAARELSEARSGHLEAVIRFNQTQHLLFYQVHGSAWLGRSE
ncbi:MAG: TolC family protein [Planctomycetes bacterium]|nr:TolC family protein [Planctomycetota bacterium]